MSYSREEFEQAFLNQYTDFERFENGEYMDDFLQQSWIGWQASRQALEGEAIGFLQSSGVSQLSGGYPAKLYPIDATPSPFESSTLVYTHPARRQALEGEPTAIVNDSGVLEWYPPYNRPPAGTKLYTHPASAEVTVPLETACHIYNSGYQAGHNDTVEGGFTDIHHIDRGEYHSDVVQELLVEIKQEQGDE